MEGGSYQDGSFIAENGEARNEDVGVDSRPEKRLKAEIDATPPAGPAVVFETKTNPGVREVCEDLLRKLEEKDAEWDNIFAFDLRAEPPITYLEKVQHPICLTDIRRRMQGYETLEQFLRDVRIMFANCASFNIGYGFDDPDASLRLWALEFLKIIDANVDEAHRLMPDWEKCMTVLDDVLTALHTQSPTFMLNALNEGDEFIEVKVGINFFTRPCPPFQEDIEAVDKYIRQLSKVGPPMDLNKLTHLLLEGDIKTAEEFGSNLLLISENCKKAEAQKVFKDFPDVEKLGKKVTEGFTMFQAAAAKALKEHMTLPDSSSSL